MNNQKYLYGKLNSKTAKPNYEGVETESLTITVDNENMTISGDVKWADILGQTADKAYPGNLGARNYAKIIELAQQLDQEIKRALQADSSHEASLQQLSDQIITEFPITEEEYIALTVKDNELSDKIIDEVSRALAAEAELLDKLLSQKTSTDSQYNALKQSVADLQATVSALTTVSDEAVNEEKQRALQAESKLSAQIQSEVNRAVDAEADLEAQLETAVSTFEAASTELSKQIADEVTTRQAEVAALQTALEAEIQRSTDIDKTHTEQITHVVNIAHKNQSDIVDVQDKLDASVSELKQYTDNKTNDVYTYANNSIELLISKTDENARAINCVKTHTDEELEKHTVSIQQNENNISNVTELVQSIEQINTEQAESIDSLGSDLIKLSDKLAEVEQTADANSLLVSSLNTQLIVESNKRSEEVESLGTAITELDKKISDHVQESKDYSSDIEAVEQKQQELQDQVTRLDEDHTRIDEVLLKNAVAIKGVEVLVSEETARAQAAENQIQNAIDAHSTAIGDLTEDLNTANQNITQLTNKDAAQDEAIKQLQEKTESLSEIEQAEFDAVRQDLVHEVERSTAIDTQLMQRATEHETKLSQVDSSIVAIKEQQDKQTTQLQTITSTIVNMSDTDGELQSQLNMLSSRIYDETVRACSAEQTLTSDINSTKEELQNISDKVDSLLDTNSESNISSVTQLISEETARAQSVEAELAATIDQEIQRSRGMDVAHISRLDNIEHSLSDIDNKFVEKYTPQSSGEFVYTESDSGTKVLQADAETSPDTLVKRDAHGGIIVPVDEQLIPETGLDVSEYYATSKRYVDMKTDNLRQELVNMLTNITWIDGGSPAGN